MLKGVGSSPIGAAISKTKTTGIVIGTLSLGLLGEKLFEHTVLAWISEGAMEAVGIHGPGDILRWCVANPFDMVLLIAAGYCVYVVTKGKLLSAPASTLHLPTSYDDKSSWRRSLMVGIPIGLLVLAGVAATILLYGLFREPPVLAAHVSPIATFSQQDLSNMMAGYKRTKEMDNADVGAKAADKPNTPTVGTINQGPCGVVQVGGQNNKATGGTCGVSPESTWQLSIAKCDEWMHRMDALGQTIVSVGAFISNQGGSRVASILGACFNRSTNWKPQLALLPANPDGVEIGASSDGPKLDALEAGLNAIGLRVTKRDVRSGYGEQLSVVIGTNPIKQP